MTRHAYHLKMLITYLQAKENFDTDKELLDGEHVVSEPKVGDTSSQEPNRGEDLEDTELMEERSSW